MLMILLSLEMIVNVYLVESLFEFSFHMKSLGLLRYFLEIEIARSPKGLSLSQRKYLTYLLKEIGILGFKPIDTPMYLDIRLNQNLGEPLADPR